MKTTRIALVSLAALAAAGVVRAGDGPPPHYLVALVATTPAYRPPGGPFDGFQHDLTPSLGFGRYVSRTLALELDAGLTYVRGHYSSLSLVPGVVWSFHPTVYGALRFTVPVDPRWNVSIMPGVGAIHVFKSGLAPFLEACAFSYVGRGERDLGVGVTAGVLYSF